MASPFAWGDPDEVRRRFQGRASSIEVAQRTLTFEFDSPAEGWAFWERTNPPQIALRTMLPEETYQELQARGARLMRELNRADGGRLVLESGYVLVLATKRDRVVGACGVQPPGSGAFSGG